LKEDREIARDRVIGKTKIPDEPKGFAFLRVPVVKSFCFSGKAKGRLATAFLCFTALRCASLLRDLFL
jgi:hypothetical protein